VPIELRTELRPGDLGRVAYLHGTLYAREYGWDATFEAYVAAGLAEFVLDHDPARERIWLAERDGDIVGSIAIVRARGAESGGAAVEGAAPVAGKSSPTPEEVAQLRWFLVCPEVRGRRVGRRLIGEALAFCRAAGYRRVILWTVAGLEAAAHLYRAAGFRRVEAMTHEQWGRVVTEERYELELS
jgi:GNAT superfamily N-acetyltransferase